MIWSNDVHVHRLWSKDLLGVMAERGMEGQRMETEEQ
jgi:hypothetical protein